ncbi:MAG: ribonuclease R [Planctomycetales bacterium]|nr:ribonuclease R [Planctomycetales bacterium]
MAENPELQQAILDLVNAPNYQPVKPRVIAKKLNYPPEQKQDVRRAVKRLAKRGLLSYGTKHLVRPAGQEKKRDKGLIVGVFRRAAAGFGFVRPKLAAGVKQPTEDIFIPARKTLDAHDGDTVEVRLSRGGHHRRREGGRRDDGRGGEALRQAGEIVSVLERETNRFVGTYSSTGGVGRVVVDGGVFNEPIYVGDPGAKNVQDGDKVVVEMVRFPAHAHDGEGVVVEVLGAKGEPGVDTLSIIREFNLPDAFPAAALDVARQQAQAFDESVPEGRRDLTGMTIITIDPIDARDFDDAISLERLDNGHWRLGVHIADVSHFVPAGSALDDEARDRATSVYLPDRVIPMLPEIISNNLASLQPNRVRFAKTAFIEFTPEGIRVDTETCNAAIQSKRRFTYEEVDEYLADRDAWREKLTPEVFELVGRMHELAMVLRRRRLDGGAIELTLPETKIDIDKDGRVAGAHLVEHTESHQIIEEFMLAANEAVASLLNDRGLNFLRRVHAPPKPEKLDMLTDFVKELGIACEHLRSRFEIKRVVEAVQGEPQEHAVHYAVLRAMQKAVYSPEVEGHYALNSDQYCHFTSPIRRYPDLTIHRMLDAIMAGRRPADDFDQQMLLGDHCSRREQRAERAERELVKVKLLTYLSTRIGEEMDAVITGVEEYGLFVQGIDLPAEGLIHVTALGDDYFDYEKSTHSLSGRREGNQFRLGDLLRVAIARVDIDRRQLDFRLVKKMPRPGQAPPRKARSKPATRGRKTRGGEQEGSSRRKKSNRPSKGKRKRS